MNQNFMDYPRMEGFTNTLSIINEQAHLRKNSPVKNEIIGE